MKFVDIGERLRQQETAELLTAAPTVNLSVASANAVGTSNYFARADHSHAITSSANPGGAASLLSTTAAGCLQLLRLGVGAACGGDNQIAMADGGSIGIIGNELLTFNAAGNATFSGVGSVVVPDGSWVGADAACSWVFDSTNGDVTTLDDVGINEVAPDSWLHITDDNTLTKHLLHLKGGGVGGNFGMLVEAAGGDDLFLIDTLTYYVTMATTGGRVGIGTATPGTDLDVSGGFRVAGFQYPAAGAGMELNYQAGVGYIAAHDRTGATYMPLKLNGSNVEIGIAGNELLTFNAAGTAVFSGCSLAVSAAIATMTFTSTTGTNEAFQIYRNTGGDMYFGKNRSAVGGLAPGALAYAGVWNVEGAYAAQIATNGAVRVTVDAAGGVTIAGLGGGGNQDVGADNAGLLYVPFVSDAKFKKDVESISGALEAICSLRGVAFDWDLTEIEKIGLDFKNGDRQVGLIAQEVEPHLPLVVGDSSKGYKTVDIKKVIPYLVEAIKAQQIQIEELQGAL